MSVQKMIANSPVAAIISDPRQPDNPIIDCNDAFVALTGYARADIIGRNCRFLKGPDTEPALSTLLRDAIREKRPALVEILNYRKDGTPFRNAVMVAPIFDANGAIEFFLGSQVGVEEPGASLTARRATARERIDGLSDRQRTVLIAMAAGLLNKQIAWQLGLTERTVKMHRAALFQSLGVTTSAEAIRIAVEAGF